nr:DUF4385 family protein [Anaerolineae bacterium]
GYTRSRRYANHKNGHKYSDDHDVLPRDEDPVKAESARIFYAKYKQAKLDPDYMRMKKAHQAQYEADDE